MFLYPFAVGLFYNAVPTNKISWPWLGYRSVLRGIWEKLVYPTLNCLSDIW